MMNENFSATAGTHNPINPHLGGLTTATKKTAKPPVTLNTINDLLDAHAKNLNQRIHDNARVLDSKADLLSKKVAVLDKKFDDSVEAVDKKVEDNLEGLNKTVNERLNAVDGKINFLVTKIDERFSAMDKKMNYLEWYSWALLATVGLLFLTSL